MADHPPLRAARQRGVGWWLAREGIHKDSGEGRGWQGTAL